MLTKLLFSILFLSLVLGCQNQTEDKSPTDHRKKTSYGENIDRTKKLDQDLSERDEKIAQQAEELVGSE